MRIKLCAALFYAASVVYSQSPTAAQPAWAQEPDSFLGIKFGAPLAASVSECPTVMEYGSPRYEWQGFGKPCFQPIVQDFFAVRNVPNFISVIVGQLNGNVENVGGFFARDTGNTIKDALISKFGEPHRRSIKKKQNGVGATFEDEELVWTGKSVEIEFNSLAAKIDQGSVSGSTAEWQKHLEDSEKKKQGDIQGVL